MNFVNWTATKELKFDYLLTKELAICGSSADGIPPRVTGEDPDASPSFVRGGAWRSDRRLHFRSGTDDAPGTATATPPAPTVSPTAEAAVVNGEVIYEIAVQRALDRVPTEKRNEARPKIIEYLADNLLIDQSLRGAGYKADETEVAKRVGDMKTELKKIGRDFDKMLGELKVTEKELREHIAADLRWFKYASALGDNNGLNEMFTNEKDMFDGTGVRGPSTFSWHPPHPMTRAFKPRWLKSRK
ncbi:MAG UNVERIFIED_CONTAM: SurA N-terminal domain-containing protein [Rickettsiaceae bacterium]